MYIHICTSVYIYIYTYTYDCIQICMHVSRYIYIYIYTYIDMCIYIYIYIQTYMHGAVMLVAIEEALALVVEGSKGPLGKKHRDLQVKGTEMRIPNREPQQSSRNVVGICLPVSLYSDYIPTIFLRFSISGSLLKLALGGTLKSDLTSRSLNNPIYPGLKEDGTGIPRGRYSGALGSISKEISTHISVRFGRGECNYVLLGGMIQVCFSDCQ